MPTKKKTSTKKAVKRTAAVKAKKTTGAKKVAVKKKAAPTTAKKTTVKSAPPKITKPMTKTELFSAIADHTGIAKKEVGQVFEILSNYIHGHLQGKNPNVFTLPGLLKVKVIRKPATKARKGINPFTGEETVFKAKPARNVVKVLPLKKLKEMVS